MSKSHKVGFFLHSQKALKCFTDSSSTRCSSSSCIILINTNSRQRPKKFRKFFSLKILPKRNRKRQNSDTSESRFFCQKLRRWPISNVSNFNIKKKLFANIRQKSSVKPTVQWQHTAKIKKMLLFV